MTPIAELVQLVRNNDPRGVQEARQILANKKCRSHHRAYLEAAMRYAGRSYATKAGKIDNKEQVRIR